MIAPGQKLIRYIDGIKPTLTTVMEVRNGVALTEELETLDAQTLRPFDDNCQSDRYEVLTEQSRRRFDAYRLCYQVSFTLMPMQRVRLLWRAPEKGWLS